MKTLSVILPNYNHAHWLRRSLRAHAEQADRDTEIIVVDDGSTDDSLAVIARLMRRYPSIQLIQHGRNRGVGAAIATGHAAATGTFVFFAAADDLVLPGLFQTAIMALQEQPQAALFCSGTGLIDTEDRILGFRPITTPRAGAGYVTPAQVRRAIRGTDNWFIGTSVIYRRAHLEAVGCFDEELGSLSDGLTNRLLAFKHGFCFEPRVLSAWRRYASSQSGQVALTSEASQASLQTAAAWIATHYPADVRDWYGPLFDRRYRYNLARLRLIWSGGRPSWRELADLLRLGAIDAAVVRALCHVPKLSTKLILAWLTLRLRPFSLWALAKAGWRSMTVGRTKRRALQRLLLSESPIRTTVAEQGSVVRVEA